MRPPRFSLCMLAATALAATAAAQRLQAPREDVTAGGLRMWHFQGGDPDRFSIAVLVSAGSRDEDPQRAGLAHLLQHVLFASCSTRGSARNDQELRDRGVEFGGYTTHSATVLHATGPLDEWRFIVDWLADHVVRPRWLSGDVETERGSVLEEIATRQAHVAPATFESLLYPGQALGRPVGGSERTVKQVTAADLREYYDRHYRTGNTVIGFSGAVPRDDCVSAVKAAFAELQPGDLPAASQPLTSLFFGDSTLFARAPGGRLVTGYHLLPGRGFAESAQGMVRLAALAGYLHERFAAEVCDQRSLSAQAGVELIGYRDAQRLQFEARLRDGRAAARIVAVVDELLEEVADPAPALVDHARNAERARFEVRGPGELGAVLQLAADLVRRGSSPREYLELAGELAAKDLALAADELRPERRFRISDVAVPAPSSYSWVVVVVSALGLLLVLRSSRRVRTAVRGIWRRPRPRAPGGDGVIEPVDGDELERDFQRFFEEEDRSRES